MIQVQNIGKSRCAACGSNRVMYDTKKEGYSVSKGLIGTALLGAAGAIVGTDGKKTGYYHCPACGITLSYAMPEETSLHIDKLLLNPASNENECVCISNTIRTLSGRNNNQAKFQ